MSLLSQFARSAMTTGIGALTAIPGYSANGTALGTKPTNATGVRLYLPSGSTLTFTIAASQPVSAPTATFQIGASTTGPNWDENLNGQNIYVTAMTGAPLFRWY